MVKVLWRGRRVSGGSKWERTASKWEVGGGCTSSFEERDRFLRQARWWGNLRGAAELAEDDPGCSRARAKGAAAADALDAYLSCV